MSSKSKNGQKRPLIRLNLNELRRRVIPPMARQEQQQQVRSTSTSSHAEQPIMGGIITTSGMELPFDIDQDDVIFQNAAAAGREQQQKNTSQSSSTQAPTELKATHAEQNANESDDDMDISDNSSAEKRAKQNANDGDMDITSTESEDSSIDIPIPRKRSPSEKKRQQALSMQPKGLEKSQLRQTFAPPEPQAKAPADQSLQERRSDDKGNDAAMHVDTKETATQSHEPQETVHAPSSTLHEKEVAVSSKDSAVAERSTEQSGHRSSEGPPKKRPRTEQVLVDANRESERVDKSLAENVAAENKENTSSVERETPPWGDPPRPNLNEEEQRLFDKIDRMILDDEWKELHDKIENEIVEVEEKDLMSRIDQSIRAAEEASKPGGRVEYTAWVDEDGSFREEYTSVTQDPISMEDEQMRTRRLDATQEERVSCVEDLSREVSHKMRLPKYARDSKERLLNREALNSKIVAPILAHENGFVLPRKLTVKLDDAPDDHYSVVLRCQGHPDLVKRVEEEVTKLTGTYQSRAKPQGSPVPSPGDRDKQRREAQSEKQQRNFSAWHTFLEYYKDIKELEYKGTPIHMQRVNKAMWDNHKNILDLITCGEDCPCPRDLKLLTRDVVKSYIANETKKDPSWRNPLEFPADESPVGFVNHFAPKFFERLEREFPDEHPKQILQRLVLMWREHRKHQRFGIKCSKHCSCNEGWDVIFKRGRLRENELAEEKEIAKDTTSKSATLQIPRKQPSNERERDAAPRNLQSEQSEDAARKPLPARIPRRSSPDHSWNAATTRASSSLVSSLHPQSEPAAVRIPRRQPSLERSTAVLSSNPLKPNASIPRKAGRPNLKSPTRSYEIHYNAGEAMSFFCETDYRKDGPVCQITSLSDSATRKDSRLQPGAVVSDVTHANGNTQTVRTHTDLKLHYEKAKKSGTSLRVRFTNPITSSSTWIGNMPSQQAKHGEWTASGEWTGSSSQGWPGGAQCVSLKGPQVDQSFAASAFQGNREMSCQLSLPMKTDDAQSKPVAPSLQYSTTMTPAKHRKLPPPKSILRKSLVSDVKPEGKSLFKQMAGTGPKKRKVNFSDANEKRFYEPKSVSYKLATEVSDSQPDEAAAATDSSSREVSVARTVGTKELIDALENKGFKDVIAVLQAGACPSTLDDSNKSPKDHVKDRLEALKFEQQHDPGNLDLAAKKKDFELKRKVLSIYIDAISTIDKARFNKKWERFDVKIERIKDVCLSVSGEERPGLQVLDCRTYIKGEEMKQMPLIPMQGTIMHSWRNDPSFRPYRVNYNPHLPDNSRSSDIVVCLYKGIRSDSQVLLGRSVIPISRISASVASKDPIEERLPPNEFLTSAAIVLAAERAKDKDETRKAKSREIAAKLKEVIQWIIQFNKETKGDGEQDVETLSGHIRAPQCRISLLHAAIYLDEPDLVKQLMKLGADPEAPSDVGCARMLGVNMLGERTDDESREVLFLLKGASTSPEASQQEGGSERNSGDEGESVPPAVAHEALTDSSVSAQSLGTGYNVASLPPYASLATQGTNDRSLPPERSASPSAQNNESRIVLPVFDFWIKAGEQPCRFFGRGAGCRHGRGCRYLHVSPLLGRALDTHTGVLELNTDNIIVKCLRNESSTELYTAAYLDPNENALYRAEGGLAVGGHSLEGGLAVGGHSLEGVYWYKNEEAAIDALRRVISFHKYQSDSSGIYGPPTSSSGIYHGPQSSTSGIYGPQSARLKRSHEEHIDSRNEQRPAKGRSKRARHERNDTTASSRERPNSILERLLRNANLSNIHSAIFEKVLKKTDWDIRINDHGLVTATLISPLDCTQQFKPSPEGGGEWIDGTYWFKDVTHAKASAFLSLLQSCIKFGQVNADCTKTGTGKRIHF